jgi:hypothetical protein
VLINALPGCTSSVTWSFRTEQATTVLMGTTTPLRRALGFCAASVIASLGFAQPIVDIDLRSTSAGDSLQIYARANGTPFDQLVSSIVFTVRWSQTSGATVGNRVQLCATGFSFNNGIAVVGITIALTQRSASATWWMNVQVWCGKRIRGYRSCVCR